MIQATFAILVLAAAVFTYRLVAGPSLADRIVALNGLLIVGIGGIASWQGALQYLMAGAQAIQVGTASFVNPHACQEILAGLERWASWIW